VTSNTVHMVPTDLEDRRQLIPHIPNLSSQRMKHHLIAISPSVVIAAPLSMLRLLVDILTTHHRWRRYLQADLTHPVPNMQSRTPNNRLILQAEMGHQLVNLLQSDTATMIADPLATTFHHPRRSTHPKAMFAMTLNTPHILLRLSPAIRPVLFLVHNLILKLLRPKQLHGHHQVPSRLRIYYQVRLHPHLNLLSNRDGLSQFHNYVTLSQLLSHASWQPLPLGLFSNRGVSLVCVHSCPPWHQARSYSHL
jgi:hypothetical protein